MSMSLCKSKQNVEDTRTKKIFNINQQDRSSSHQMEHIILQNKLKREDTSTFCSFLKGSARNGVLHNGQNPSSGSAASSRQSAGACDAQGSINNNSSIANDQIAPEQNSNLNCDQNINAMIAQHLFDDLNESSQNDGDLKFSSANNNDFNRHDANNHIDNDTQIGNNDDSVIESILHVNKVGGENDPLAIYDPDNANFYNLSMLDHSAYCNNK